MPNLLRKINQQSINLEKSRMKVVFWPGWNEYSYRSVRIAHEEVLKTQIDPVWTNLLCVSLRIPNRGPRGFTTELLQYILIKYIKQYFLDSLANFWRNIKYRKVCIGSLLCVQRENIKCDMYHRISKTKEVSVQYEENKLKHCSTTFS